MLEASILMIKGRPERFQINPMHPNSFQRQDKARLVQIFCAMFPYAAASDILRSNQKDEYYLQHFQNMLNEVTTAILGSRLQMKYSSALNYLTKIVYLGSTTLSSSQTLGEEYADLIPVSGSRNLDWPARLELVLWCIFGGYGMNRFFDYLKSKFIEWKRPKWVERLELLKRIVLGPLYSLHIALFYLTGKYHSFTKRLLGIRYRLIRKLRPGEEDSGYEILGVLIILQLILKSISKSDSENKDYDDIDVPSAINPQNRQRIKCTLCLEGRKTPTATSCGHVFCWKCIADWCRNKPECPLCRQAIALNQLYPLANY